MLEPNAAQRQTIDRYYGGSVVSWSVKPGEYSDEERHGYAFVATLDSGWVVTVGRYGAVLSEHNIEVVFQPGQWYVMDRFASSAQRAYVSGPFPTQTDAEADRCKVNIGADCDLWRCPDGQVRDTLTNSVTDVRWAVIVTQDRGNGLVSETTHTRVLADSRHVGYSDTGILHGPAAADR